MSLATIPHSTFEKLLTNTVALYIKRGLSLDIARRQAAEDMARAFASEDFQRDYIEQREGDWTR